MFLTCHNGLTRVLTESSSERATWSQDSYGLWLKLTSTATSNRWSVTDDNHTSTLPLRGQETEVEMTANHMTELIRCPHHREDADGWSDSLWWLSWKRCSYIHISWKKRIHAHVLRPPRLTVCSEVWQRFHHIGLRKRLCRFWSFRRSSVLSQALLAN